MRFGAAVSLMFAQVIAMGADLMASEPVADLADSYRLAVEAGAEPDGWRDAWSGWLRALREANPTEAGFQAAVVTACDAGVADLCADPAVGDRCLAELGVVLVGDGFGTFPPAQPYLIQIGVALWERDQVAPEVGDAWRLQQALGLIDAAGSHPAAADAYRMILAGSWVDRPAAREVMRVRFLNDRKYGAAFMSACLAAPGDDDKRLLELVVQGSTAQGPADDRRELLAAYLERAADHLSEDRMAAYWLRGLLTVVKDGDGRWAGLLGPESDPALRALVSAPGPAWRLAPWLALLHGDREVCEAALAELLPICLERCADQEVAPLSERELREEPWLVVSGLAPFTLAKLEGIPIDPGMLRAITQLGRPRNDPTLNQRGPGYDQVAIDRATATLLASRVEGLLAEWYQDPSFAFAVGVDPVFHRVVAPWAFSRGLTIPWIELPKVPGGWEDTVGVLPREQCALVARLGLHPRAVTVLEDRLVAEREYTSRDLRYGLLAAAGDPDYRARLAPSIRGMAEHLPVHRRTGQLKIRELRRVVRLLRAYRLEAEAVRLLERSIDLVAQGEVAQASRLIASSNPGLDAQELALRARRMAEGSRMLLWTDLHRDLAAIDPGHPLVGEAVGRIRSKVPEVAKRFERLGVAVAEGQDGDLIADVERAQAVERYWAPEVIRLACTVDSPAAVRDEACDPRLLHGWCLGDPGQDALSPRPDDDSMLDLIGVLLARRLAADRIGP